MRRHLRADEELIWVGRPESGWRLAPGDWFWIPFGVFWVVFVIVWEGAVLLSALAARDPVAWFFVLFGIPFLLFGWFLTVGRFRMRAALRRRLIYAVTDRRVLAIERGGVDGADAVRSVFLEGLPGVGVRTARTGVGTLSFEPVPPMWAWYAGSGMEWMIGGLSALPLQFLDIKDPSRVAALIEEQRLQATRQ